MVAFSCGCVLRLERTAAGERGELREQRRSRVAERDRIHHDVGPARAIPGVGGARLTVAVVAVRQQQQRAPALRRLDGVDRRDDRVVQSSRAPALEPLDGVLLRRRSVDSGAATSICDPIATTIDWSLGRSPIEERPRRIPRQWKLASTHAEAAIDGERHRERKVPRRKGRDRLRLAVLEHREVVACQVGDGPVRRGPRPPRTPRPG